MQTSKLLAMKVEDFKYLILDSKHQKGHGCQNWFSMEMSEQNYLEMIRAGTTNSFLNSVTFCSKYYLE